VKVFLFSITTRGLSIIARARISVKLRNGDLIYSDIIISEINRPTLDIYVIVRAGPLFLMGINLISSYTIYLKRIFEVLTS